MRQFRTALGAMIDQALDEESFSLPLYLTMVGANGSIQLTRYAAGDETLEGRLLSQHTEGGTFEYPINVLITDPTGRASLHKYRPLDFRQAERWPALQSS
jgi:hypothetical protein